MTEKFKKSTVASAIAIPLPLCFSFFGPLHRFRENLVKPFYCYLSRTCDSPGGTPSVITLALRVFLTAARNSSAAAISAGTTELRAATRVGLIFGRTACRGHSASVELRAAVNISVRNLLVQINKLSRSRKLPIVVIYLFIYFFGSLTIEFIIANT